MNTFHTFQFTECNSQMQLLKLHPLKSHHNILHTFEILLCIPEKIGRFWARYIFINCQSQGWRL